MCGRKELKKEGMGCASCCGEAAEETGSQILGPAFWPDSDLTCFLSSPSVCLSAPENQEPGALGTRHFGNPLSLDSTHPGQILLATRPEEEGQRSDAFSLFLCVLKSVSM